MPLGFIILIFILIVCIITGILTVSYFINPHEKKLAVIRPMSMSILYASLLGLCAGLATTFKTATISPKGKGLNELGTTFLNGVTESFAPPIIGFAILSLVWLFVAMGIKKSHQSASVAKE